MSDETKTDNKSDETKNTGSNDNEAKNSTGDDGVKIEFTPGQQAKVQELIDAAHNKALAKASKDGDSKLTSLQEEVERLKGEADKAKKSKDKDNKGDEEWKKAIDKLRTEAEEKETAYKTQLATMGEEKKTNSILRAIAKHNVVDAGEVAELIRHQIKVNDKGELIVQGDSGEPRINQSGDHMTVDEFIGGWLADRPHHLRVEGGAGAGSPGAKFSGVTSKKYDLTKPETWRNMPKEDLDKALEGGIVIDRLNGPAFKFSRKENPFIQKRLENIKKGKGV